MAISGNIYQNMQAPDIIGGVERGLKMSDMIQKRQAERAETERQDKLNQALSKGLVIDPATGAATLAPETLSELTRTGIAKPQEIMQISGQMQAQMQEQRKMQIEEAKKKIDQGLGLAQAVLTSKNPEQIYGSARNQLLSLGLTPEELPEKYDANAMSLLVNKYTPYQQQIANYQKQQEMRMKEQESAANIALKKSQTSKNYAEASQAGKPKTADTLKIATDLRKERSGLQTTKQTNIISSSYDKIKATAENPTAAGDLSLIFAYMKMLDPESVVRETEFANAQNAAGVPERVRNVWNKAMTGKRLGDDQRKDFVGQAEKIFKAQKEAQARIDKKFEQLAKKAGADPKDVIFDIEDNSIENLSDDEIMKMYQEMGGQ